MPIRTRLIAAAVASAVVLAAPSAMAQQFINVLTGGTSGVYYPLGVAIAKIYSDKIPDVKTQVQATKASVENLILLQQGRGEIAFTLGDSLKAAWDGDEEAGFKSKLDKLRTIGAIYPNYIQIVATADSGIKTLADIKGKVMGITGTGSSTDFEMRYLGIRNGVQPDQFTRLPVGAGATFIAAFQHGQIDGGITSQPTIGRLLNSGQARVLVDLQDNAQSKKAFGGTFPSTCIYMRTDYVNKHKEAVQKLVNAVVWTLKWVHSHSASEIAAKMPADYAGTDMSLYTSAWQQSLGFYSPDGIMPTDGPTTQYKILAAFEPDLPGKHVNLKATYTNDFALKAGKTPPPKAH